jgi:hypothetical protein
MARQFLLVFAYLVAMGMAIESLGVDSPELPSVRLSRYFPAGGYESLLVECRADRTREEGFVCELKRTRNGMEVSNVVLDYVWTRDQVGKFIRRISDNRAGASAATAHVILTYDAQNDGKRLQGKVFKEASDAETAKAVLALEGSLVAQFYR